MSACLLWWSHISLYVTGEPEALIKKWFNRGLSPELACTCVYVCMYMCVCVYTRVLCCPSFSNDLGIAWIINSKINENGWIQNETKKIPTVNKETLKLQCYTADSLFTRYIYSSQDIWWQFYLTVPWSLTSCGICWKPHFDLLIAHLLLSAIHCHRSENGKTCS